MNKYLIYYSWSNDGTSISGNYYFEQESAVDNEIELEKIRATIKDALPESATIAIGNDTPIIICNIMKL